MWRKARDSNPQTPVKGSNTLAKCAVRQYGRPSSMTIYYFVDFVAALNFAARDSLNPPGIKSSNL